jgi:hypothetical protein
MRAISYITFLTGTLFLAGCQTAPSVNTAETAAPPDCVAVEPESCPVCEVQQCPEPEVVESPIAECQPAEPVQCGKTKSESDYPLVGEKEWALVEPGDLVLEARIDTGAQTSSMHAEDIQLIEKDGKRWIRFSLINPATDEKISLERRLHRSILVKQKTEKTNDRRYVVRMWVTLGDTRTWLDVSLSDREDFEFPLLLGRNMLVDSFVVDVSKHHTLPKPATETTEN